jgi:glycosyltransferase involved in cell wall biosynthesis
MTPLLVKGHEIPAGAPLRHSLFAKGNFAHRAGEFSEAIGHYVKALGQLPGLSTHVLTNIRLAQSKRRLQRQGVPLRIAVSCWELSHNAAGRAYELATLYATEGEVEIIGCHFPQHGVELWPPLRGIRFPTHSFVVRDQAQFLDQAVEFVLKHPFDVVHLSKPRAPNIAIGILYKLIWGARVAVDVDDEECSFVGAEHPVSVSSYIRQNSEGIAALDITGKIWTQLAAACASEFDALTVCNVPLQQRYGGEIIPHVRNASLFQPSAELTRRNRERFGIPAGTKVVLFFGTPREHKGLVATADAVRSLQRPDVLFVVAGEFVEESLKSKVHDAAGKQVLFIGGQPVDATADILSLGDVCVLMQDTQAAASQFQTPAKMTDAFAMHLPVIASATPPLFDLIKHGVIVGAQPDELGEKIRLLLDNPQEAKKQAKRAADHFAENLSTERHSGKMNAILGPERTDSLELSRELALFWSSLSTHERHRLLVRLGRNSAAVESEGLGAVRPAVPQDPVRKLPITVLVITWDVGHNPLGRSYMLAEVVDRVARHTVVVGFQFPRYGSDIWEPLENSRLPVISMPGSNLPEFHDSLERIAERIRPDLVIACKPRLPSVELGLMIKERWGCPLIIDIDDHELSFFKNQQPLTLDELESLPQDSLKDQTEPYGEIWTRLAEHLAGTADALVVSNVALQEKFGGTVVPHVRDENLFDPLKFDKTAARLKYGVPLGAKVVLFFGTPRQHKGIGALAEAVGKLPDSSFRLVVVGASPDRSVTGSLEKLAPGRIIFVGNQPFSAIPEIVSMADVICLPQDQAHPISRYQLPAKAIDAVAMGVPLLVTPTPPLQQLLDDGVAEPVRTVADISEALVRYGSQRHLREGWRDRVAPVFISKYSYAAAAAAMRRVIGDAIKKKPAPMVGLVARLRRASDRVLGVPASKRDRPRAAGIDIVVFWKQNDSCLYGRRSDMVVKYLASRADVRKVIVVDAPYSEHDLAKSLQNQSHVTQSKWIYRVTYEKLLGIRDTEKISYRVFVYPPGRYRYTEDGTNRPSLDEGYVEYLSSVFSAEDVDPSKSVFWIYPKNFHAPALISRFSPARVVVDVVDDHRAWPGVTEDEKGRLTRNYEELLAQADMAFANCEPVRRAMQEFTPDIRLVPNGCDTSPPMREPSQRHAAYRTFLMWPGKRIGFVGNLEAKIDIELLEKLALRFPSCQLVLIGSTHANPKVLELSRFPNVLFAGVVPYEEVGSWLRRFDVAVVPHLNMDLTKSMNPLKIYVYLSGGVPVVSTEIYNLPSDLEGVRVAASHEDFLMSVGTAMRDSERKFDARKYVQQNSWRERFAVHIDELLPSCRRSSHALPPLEAAG